VYGPDEDDVVEHGDAQLRLAGWIRRPGWLPALNWRPSRGAAILGIAGLVVGLVAGYVFGYRHLGQAVSPPRATAAGTVPPAVYAVGSGGYSSSLSIAGLSGIGLAQTSGECSVQLGGEIQVGVEMINLSRTTVFLEQARPVLPLGGLRPVSQQWGPCGAISPSWQVAGSTNMPTRELAGVAKPGSATSGGRVPSGIVLPPDGTAWLSVTFRVLVACPRPLAVHFSVSYRENGRAGAAQLPGFPDLGQVTYTGC
jgi:hypothetical protein